MKKRYIILLVLIACVQLAQAQKRNAKPRKKAKTSAAAKKSAPQKRQVAAGQPEENSGDSGKVKTVVITSAFKPSLRSSSKINFSAAVPAPDSDRPVLDYNVPSQNLFFSYQPTALKPLAANIDTTIHWENKNYVKAGFGNYTTPYLQGGLSFGDGQKQVINVHVKHVSSNGSDLSEKYSKTNAEVIGIFNPNENIEWDGKIFFDNNNQYQYGFQPDTLKFSKNDLRQRFTTFGGKVGLRNKQDNAFGLSYNPNIFVDEFVDNHNGHETNFIVDAPLSKAFGKVFAFNLGFKADVTNYKSDTSGTINNVLYSLSPAVQFKTPNLKIIAGLTPTWDNSVFSMLPNFTVDAKINQEKFILQAGWIGYVNKTTYQSLAETNPWLSQPSFLLNTKIHEAYAGFKGSGGSHLTYNARVSFLTFNNMPLFVNDTITGKSFQVVNESRIKDVRMHGEVGYTVQENFSVLAGATINHYSGLKDNDKAWGLLPLDLNAALRWQVIKDVIVKSDVYLWDGAQYRNKQLGNQKLSPALDFNAGVEFAVAPKLNLWLQMNNIFNNRYQRWDQYPVLGFNVLGGIVYSFGQSAK